jgi:hypothetical protein
MIVNLPPNHDVLLVQAGDDPGIIINRDLTQLVYFGQHSAFVTPGESSIIDALTFVNYSGDADVWAHSGGTGFCQVDVQPNCTNWSPSPAQSALSIAASGIMLDTTGQNILSNQATAAGQSSQLTAINSPGYGPLTTANPGLVARDTSITPLAKDTSITPLAKDTTVGAVTSAVNAPGYGPVSLTNAGLLAKDASITPLAKDTSLTPLAKDTSVTGLLTGIPNNIASSGVPLLTLPTQVASNTTAATIASGASVTYGPYTVYQIGYEVLFSIYTAGVTATYCRVVMIWTDPATGLKVDQQIWWLIPGSDSSTNLATYMGTGPTVNANLSIQFTAYNNSVVLTNLLIHENSRIYTRHDWRTFNGTIALGGGIGSMTHDISGMVLAASLQNVTTGSHFTIYSALFCGKVQIWVHTASNGSDCTLTLNAIADQVTGVGNIFQQKTDATGNINVQVYIPRSQLQIVVSNANAATESCSFSMVLTDG